MKAVDSQLLKLLKQSTQFIVPIYQRVYSWEQPECEQLWSDILRAGRDPTLGAHFTGSIVYVARDQSTNTSAEPDLLIDGQQRVTTVTLLLAALAERLEQLQEGEREPIDGFSPKKIRNRWLLNDDEEGERQYKLILSQADKPALISIVRGATPPADASTRVVENFEFFRRKLADPKLNLPDVCLGLDKLVVVDVTLTRTIDNPQLVFEAMNSTGKKLSQADLIRNYVLMDLPPKHQETLYATQWRPMELEFLGQPEDQFDFFVRHYLTIKTGAVTRVDLIYEAFKSYTANASAEGISVDALVTELRAYAHRYRAIALGHEPDSKLRRVFADIAQIKADPVYPFLLSAYTDYNEGTISSEEMLEIARMVVSYLFRRVVCRTPTNSLTTTFAGFASAVDRSRYLDSVKAHVIGLKSYRGFPTDAEFREALMTTDLYNFRRSSYLLRLLENYGRKEPVVTEEYTIEHILPQNENLSPEWQQALGPDWQEIQRKYLHTLGNLTLTGYNSEYSDKPFLQKRDMQGGFRESPLRLNQGLGQLETWTPVQIEARADRLADQALKIWPRPQLSAEALASFIAEPQKTELTLNDYQYLQEPGRRALFDRFSAEVLALDPGITRHLLKLYIAFKAETNFVDVVPQKARLRLSLNIPLTALHDEHGFAKDVSDIGRWGNGPTEVGLDETSDFAYLIGLVRQAYEYQLDAE